MRFPAALLSEVRAVELCGPRALRQAGPGRLSVCRVSGALTPARGEVSTAPRPQKGGRKRHSSAGSLTCLRAEELL